MYLEGKGYSSVTSEDKDFQTEMSGVYIIKLNNMGCSLERMANKSLKAGN